MKNNDLPSISALPQDGGLWRLDWFGDLAFPNRAIRRTQPSLLLHLSRVLCGGFRDDPSVLLSPDSTSPARFQRKVWVSSGTLPLLRIGDLWRNGRLEAQPDYELECFDDLLIDDTSVTLVKAGLNLAEQGFLLPLSEHPWHVQCTHSYCVMVSLPGNRRLIIPCIELIRFYFGSSSSLITKLFSPPLERKALYSNAQFDKRAGRLTLELAERVPGSSAADLGRLHLEPLAWRVALHVGTSALKASLANQQVYPQAFFPFEGLTDLVAAGKWLSFGGAGRATFIVYNLRSCSHPFPFRSLQYKVNDAHRRAMLVGGAGPAAEGQSQRRAGASDPPSQPIVEQDASNRLSSRTKEVHAEPRFPDLRRKPIWKNKTPLTSEASLVSGSTAAPVEESSLGLTGSEQRIRPVDLAIALASANMQVPGFLRDVVTYLSKLNGVEVELLPASDEDGWSVPITGLSDEDGEINLRLFVYGSAEILRLRRASIFAIKCGSEHLSVAVIESAPLHIKLYTTTGGDADEVARTLSCVVRDFLHRPESDTLENLLAWAFEAGPTEA